MRSFEVAIALGVALVAGSARADPAPIVLEQSVGHLDAFASIEVLEDRDHAFSAAELTAPPLAARFARPPSRAIGYTDSVYFVRLSVYNPSPAFVVWYLEPYRRTDQVTLYREGAAPATTGRAVSLFERDVRTPALLFPIPLRGGERATLLLRIESTNSLRLNLDLLSERALKNKLTLDWLVIGLFYGAMLALLIYNLFMFGSLGDPAYLYYSLFQLGMLAWQGVNDDLVHSLLWPHSPRWRICSESLFAPLCVVGSIGFVKTFLDLPRLSPKELNREAIAVQLFALLFALACPLATAHVYQKAALLLMPAAAILIERMTIRAWRMGSANAPFFFAGWTVLLVSLGVGAFLTRFGLVNGAKLFDVAGKTGAMIEALVLSFGLANSVNRIRRDKERMQSELLESRTAQAASLTTKVAERTRELESALETVKSAQSRMLQHARLASLGHLVAGVAHEVGNPLNFTSGGAATVEKKLEVIGDALAGLDAPQAASARAALEAAKRAAGLVSSGTERIRKIVDHLRDYVAERPIPFEPTDLVASVEKTLSLLAPQLDKQSIVVVRDLPSILEAPCRPGELGQVFMNLILNSCQAMPDGGELRVEGGAREGHAELRFSDTGPGIPPALRDAIFDPFFTTRAPSEGMGLGLSISYEIVRRHGGELQLLPSARGASFAVRIPLGGAE